MTISTAATSVSGEETLAMFRLLADRWFLLGAYGPRARFHMMAVWAILLGFAVLETVWVSLSGLSFAYGNWQTIMRLTVSIIFAFGLCGFILYRLRAATDRVGRLLLEGERRVELFAVAQFVFAMLSALIIIYCYLVAAAALPLQDARLAAIDGSLGFDWVGFVRLINSSPAASWLMVEAYRSTGFMLIGTMLWFTVSGQGERLAEFLALSCITFIGISIGVMIWPAEGAYAFYHPPLSAYENLGANAGMWHHDLLMSIRSGVTTVIDFDTPNNNCLVTFPSGHTVLAFIITYALRGSRWTFVPALMANSAMVVSTIPHGGHHLIDLIGGAAIALCAIAIVRLPLGVSDHRLAAGSLARA